ncbi:MAG: hypothetical protein ACTS10_22190 [Kiloniellales bacterium]
MSEEAFGRIRELQERQDAFNARLVTLENDLKDALQVILDILDQGGPIEARLVAVEKALSDLHADLQLSEDAFGDSKTIDAIEASLSEIKRSIGVR